MKKVVLIITGLIVALIIGLLCLMFYVKKQLEPVNINSADYVEFNIKKGDTYYSIAPRLEEKGLIKNKDIYQLYIKLNKPKDNLKVGLYRLSPNMDVDKILNTLASNGISGKDITITFKEGLIMLQITKVNVSNTNNTEKDVYITLKDKEYLNELINKYWFIDKSILNSKIYYPLEGYLYPNTYNFKNKDVTVKEIFNTLLNETEKQLEPYKTTIINHKKYNAHNIFTLASIIELEAKTDNDRLYVSSVFYNRINKGITLGSDVTTYYDAQVDMSERDLYKKELLENHGYNTRSNSQKGLPVGPICNPSISSIKAALMPKTSNYYYFVSDNKGKVYFTKTYYEHQILISKLKNEGLWERY